LYQWDSKYDLVIDEMAGTVQLPATQCRKSRREVPLNHVESMYVETIQQP